MVQKCSNGNVAKLLDVWTKQGRIQARSAEQAYEVWVFGPFELHAEWNMQQGMLLWSLLIRGRMGECEALGVALVAAFGASARVFVCVGVGGGG